MEIEAIGWDIGASNESVYAVIALIKRWCCWRQRKEKKELDNERAWGSSLCRRPRL